MKWYLLILVSLLSLPLNAEESSLPELTPEQLERFQFQQRDTSTPPTIVDLSVGQQVILNAQREELKDLIALKLGILTLKGDRSDLRVLQQLYDRKVLRDDQLKEWQSAGVLFGDILVREFGLHWVSYEDELGASKALQWRDTQNFVFPITVFSKRLQFGEKIDVDAVYEKIAADIEAFKDRERRLRG